MTMTCVGEGVMTWAYELRGVWRLGAAGLGWLGFTVGRLEPDSS